RSDEIVGDIYGDTEKSTHVIDEIKLSLSTKEQVVIYMGISNEYHYFSYLRKSYLESLEVVETSVFLNKGSVFALNYCDLGINRYLKDIYKKNIPENQYHPTYFIIISIYCACNSELV